MSVKSVSLIICCYNSSEVIVPTIESINKLIIPDKLTNIGLIIVDNNCSDNTINLINQTFTSNTIKLEIVEEKIPGLMNARRKGVEAAGGDVIIFVDDDNLLSFDYVEKIVEIFSEKPTVGVVGGQVIPGVDNFPTWFLSFMGVYACGRVANKSLDVSTTRMTLFGAGLSFRSELIKLILLKNFHSLALMGRTENTLLRGDDSELCMLSIINGWHVWYQNDLILHHNILERRINWEYVKNARFGGGMASVVLDMYRLEILNKPIDSYFVNFSKSLIVFSRFIFSNKFKKRDFEGSKESFEYYSIKGRIYALLKVFTPKKYNKMKKYINGIKK